MDFLISYQTNQPLKKLLLLFLICLIHLCCIQEKKLGLHTDNSQSLAFLEKITSNDISSVDKLVLIDSALHEQSENVIDTFFLKLILRKSNLLYGLKKKDSAAFYDRLLLQKATKANNTLYQATSSNNIGLDLDEQQKFDSAFYYFNLSKKYSLELGDSLRAARRLLSMAHIQSDFNDHYGAKETVVEALEYLKTTKNTTQISRANDLLGTLNRLLLNFEDAIAYHLASINISDDAVTITGYRNNLALVYRDVKNYPKAISILEDVLQDSILSSNSSRYARVLHNIAYIKWKNGDRDIEPLFLYALTLRKNNGDMRGLVSSYSTVGEYFAESEPAKAKKYLDSCISVSKQLKMPGGEIDALKILLKIQPNSTSIRDRYIFLKDSLSELELKVKTQFAKMKYDDDQEKARLLRLETETAQKETQLAQERAQSILFISLSSILLVSGISFYFLLHQRHKREKLREVYNTEKRISQRLHDGLANDIFSFMTKVENEADFKKNELLDGLENIYSRTREISHENSSIRTSNDFLEELKNLIKNYQGNGITIITKGIEDIDWATLDEQKCVALHRSLNELMVNLKKHSQANLVGLRFSYEKNVIKLNYNDNGIGFPLDIKYGVGLQNTVSRIRGCGGTIKFIPKEKTGAAIEIIVPA